MIYQFTRSIAIRKSISCDHGNACNKIDSLEQTRSSWPSTEMILSNIAFILFYENLQQSYQSCTG